MNVIYFVLFESAIEHSVIQSSASYLTYRFALNLSSLFLLLAANENNHHKFWKNLIVERSRSNFVTEKNVFRQANIPRCCRRRRRLFLNVLWNFTDAKTFWYVISEAKDEKVWAKKMKKRAEEKS